MMRGRPRKTDPEEVLATAMNLFWEKGYNATSMNDLATATGMAKPGLYATFGDKEALYTKALAFYFNELGSQPLVDLVQSPYPVDKAIRQFLNTVAASILDDSHPIGCFVLNNIIDYKNKPAPLDGLTRNIDNERRVAFLERLKIAKKKGELPNSTDEEALAGFFAGQTLALAVMGCAGAGAKNMKSFIDVAMTVLPKVKK